MAHFANVIYCDVRDLPGDRMAGVPTIPVRFGKRASYRAIAVVSAVWLFAALVAWLAWGWIDAAHYGVLLLANGIYPAAIWLLRERTFAGRVTLDCAVELMLPLFAVSLVALRFLG